MKDGDDARAAAMRAFARNTDPAAHDEEAAWRILASKMEGKPTPLRRPGWYLLGIACATAGVLLALGYRHQPPGGHRSDTPPEEAPIVSRAPQAPEVIQLPQRSPAATETRTAKETRPTARPNGARGVRVALTERPVPIAPGQTDFIGQAVVDLTPEGHATAVALPTTTRIDLGAGQMNLSVVPRAPGRTFQVDAGRYDFVVVGTVFRVAREGDDNVRLWVTEGRVAVVRDHHQLAVVTAGQTWTSAEPYAHATVDTCRQLSSTDADQNTMGCYLALARGNDLSAEMALYEAARLERDDRHDAAAAVRRLEEYRRRYPQGSLRAEVELSLVDLLPRLGRHAEALTLSASLLAGPSGAEHAGELHLLRGNIYREVLADCARAASEYGKVPNAAPGAGGVVDDARFFQAICLEATEQRAQAAEAYRLYLGTHGAGKHAAEAKKRLTNLTP